MVFVLVAGALIAAARVPAWSRGPHQKTPVKLTSTLRTEYRIMQGDQEIGREAVEKKVFGNNTVVFTVDANLKYGEGVTMKQHLELTLEEESFFPRSLHLLKTITQPDSQFFNHQVDVEMYSNVAVVSSKLRDQVGSRRIVVPSGVALTDLGVIGYLYQTLFWYDDEVGGGQRFQWLDPIGVTINGGEIKRDGEATIPVMGKKSKVNVYKLERERLGPATLWVDKQGVIVRGEQTMFVYELVSRKSS
jgi:hypothetical protein